MKLGDELREATKTNNDIAIADIKLTITRNARKAADAGLSSVCCTSVLQNKQYHIVNQIKQWAKDNNMELTSFSGRNETSYTLKW